VGLGDYKNKLMLVDSAHHRLSFPLVGNLSFFKEGLRIPNAFGTMTEERNATNC
jgi:hypothetical protein